MNYRDESEPEEEEEEKEDSEGEKGSDSDTGGRVMRWAPPRKTVATQLICKQLMRVG